MYIPFQYRQEFFSIAHEVKSLQKCIGGISTHIKIYLVDFLITKFYHLVQFFCCFGSNPLIRGIILRTSKHFLPFCYANSKKSCYEALLEVLTDLGIHEDKRLILRSYCEELNQQEFKGTLLDQQFFDKHFDNVISLKRVDRIRRP